MAKELILCKTCFGSGYFLVNRKLDQPPEACSFCKGSGRVWRLIKYVPYDPTKPDPQGYEEQE